MAAVAGIAEKSGSRSGGRECRVGSSDLPILRSVEAVSFSKDQVVRLAVCGRMRIEWEDILRGF